MIEKDRNKSYFVEGLFDNSTVILLEVLDILLQYFVKHLDKATFSPIFLQFHPALQY